MEVAGMYTRAFYLVLQSDTSKLFYPKNNATHFRVKLSDRVIFSGQWVCGLVEIRVPAWNTESVSDDPLYVTTSLVRDTIVGDTKLPILRRVFANPIFATTSLTFLFDNVMYFPLNTHDFDEVEIQLRKIPGNKPIDLGSAVTYCTIHFMKQVGLRHGDGSHRNTFFGGAF